MPESGGYVLNLECDVPNCTADNPVLPWKKTPFRDSFYKSTRTFCVTQAREKGWIFHRNNTLTCPKCNPVKNKTL